ncbi:MAG: hypothetical protein EBY74_06410 [Actinobacteria bacterium]|nr:hypothetical protein [Actinomycetota bacterium]
MEAFIQPGFWIFVLAMAGIYGVFSLGLQIQYGVAGVMNFGHVGMMAITGYAIAILVIRFQWRVAITSQSQVSLSLKSLVIGS